MTLKPFENQVAIVTGAGQGIGFEICRQLLQNGASVLLNDIDDSLTRESVGMLRADGRPCIGLSGDAADPQVVSKMVATAAAEFGRVTIAIANAGITLFGDFLDYDPQSLYKVVHTNIGGSFFLAQAAAKQIKAQGSGGSILFMSSVTGHQAHKNLAAYSMTKAAVEMLAKNLVIELSSIGININAIAPGATITERTSGDPQYKETWSQLTPMGRPAYPVDVARAALFLVSPESRHITGQSLIIDGGWTSISPSPYEK